MRWSFSPSLIAGGLASLIAVGIGIYASRPDLVAVALPVLVAVAWAFERGVRQHPDAHAVRVEVAGDPSVDGPSADTGSAGTPKTDGRNTDTPGTNTPGTDGLAYQIQVAPQASVDLVQLRLTLAGVRRWFVVSTASAARLTGRAPVPHSGRQRILDVETRFIAADGGVVSGVLPAVGVARVVRPRVRAVDALPDPRRLHGASGVHESRRRGEGGGFRDVGLFEPGDRLRRIDWKATARHAQRADQLYVRRTFQSADATVVVVIDSRDDLPARVAQWSRATLGVVGATSMDLAREAAVSYAAAFIAAGDRVGLHDLGTTAHTVLPQGGRRHLDRLVRTVSLARPRGSPTRGGRAPILVPGAMVLVLSTFLDDEATGVAVQWQAGGHRVVAVDVLARPDLSGLEPHEVQAFRLVMLERERRIRRARGAGIEVVRWNPGAPVGVTDARAGRAKTPRVDTRRAPRARRTPGPRLGPSVPAWTARALLLVVGAAVCCAQTSFSPVLLVGSLALAVLSAVVPRLLTAWWVIVILELAQLAHRPGTPSGSLGQIAAVVAGILLLHVLAQLCLTLPMRATVQLAALVPLARRVVLALIGALSVAVGASLLGGAHLPAGSPVGVVALLIGAAALASIAVLLTRLASRASTTASPPPASAPMPTPPPASPPRAVAPTPPPRTP